MGRIMGATGSLLALIAIEGYNDLRFPEYATEPEAVLVLQELKRRTRLAPKVQCPRCGLIARIAKTGRRLRFKINVYDWSMQCKALKADPSLRTPFRCPAMAAATAAASRRGAR